MRQYVWGGTNAPEIHVAISQWVSFHSFGVKDNVWPDGASFGVLDDGVPVGGIVFHDFNPMAETIQYSGAATKRNWLTGPALHLIFGFMFEDLGCQMALTGNASDNTGLHRILERLDHTKHVIKRGWGRNTDLFLWALTKEQWAANKIMQRSRRAAMEAAHVKGT